MNYLTFLKKRKRYNLGKSITNNDPDQGQSVCSN